MSDEHVGAVGRSGMIWTDVIEEYPEDTHIHPLYDGQGTNDRKYRPAWHAVEAVKGRRWENDDQDSEGAVA